MANAASGKFSSALSRSSIGMPRPARRAAGPSGARIIQRTTWATTRGCSSRSKPSLNQKSGFDMSFRVSTTWVAFIRAISLMAVAAVSTRVSLFGLSTSSANSLRMSAVKGTGRLLLVSAWAIQPTLVMFFAHVSDMYCMTACATSSRILAAPTLPESSACWVAYVRSIVAMIPGMEGSCTSSVYSSMSSPPCPSASYLSNSSSALDPLNAVMPYKSTRLCKSSASTDPLLSVSMSA
mmetsp:Transcript_42283/g.97877  ORF Transcript_42283/g.97877 Transcript_42283/m.97877 type:complete len:237 (+) Transcript_42283:1501-2211(+)